MLMAGYGMGSYDVDTERLDLGTGNTTITGESEADIDYYHIAVMQLNYKEVNLHLYQDCI